MEVVFEIVERAPLIPFTSICILLKAVDSDALATKLDNLEQRLAVIRFKPAWLVHPQGLNDHQSNSPGLGRLETANAVLKLGWHFVDRWLMVVVQDVGREIKIVDMHTLKPWQPPGSFIGSSFWSRSKWPKDLAFDIFWHKWLISHTCSTYEASLSYRAKRDYSHRT